MAVLKVHGHPESGPTRRVLSALHEKGLEFDFVTVDLAAGEHKKEPFLSLNPFGQIPAFEDGDLKMFESRAITQYVAHTYAGQGTDLVFRDARKMAEMSVWAEVEAHHFDPLATKIVFELVIKARFGLGTTDEAAVAELQGGLAKVLDVYEARLASGSKYLSGESFGIADLHHQPTVHYLLGTPAKALFEERPHVSRWAADVVARPAWAKVLALQSSA